MEKPLLCGDGSRGFVLTLNHKRRSRNNIPFSNKNFKLVSGKQETGFDFGIRLEANHRKLLLYAEDSMTFFKFIYVVKSILSHLQGPEINPFGSFAPPRKIENTQFLVDGEEYFEVVYEALEKAEWQIMICL